MVVSSSQDGARRLQKPVELVRLELLGLFLIATSIGSTRDRVAHQYCTPATRLVADWFFELVFPPASVFPLSFMLA
jgi:hypothetical protein